MILIKNIEILIDKDKIIILIIINMKIVKVN